MNDEAIKALILSKIKDPATTIEDKQYWLAKLRERNRAKKLNKLSFFKPYEFQKKFYKQGANTRFRFLCAGNRTGKSRSAAMEVAYHLTGLYPQWWEGYRFKRPIQSWAIGITTKSTRDTPQYELLGIKNAKILDNKEFDDFDMGVLGSGSIPLYCINRKSIERDGETVLSFEVKHFDENGKYNGNSRLEFRSTQAGQDVLMGTSQHLIWLDEEDPFISRAIFEQCMMRTTTPKGLIIQTATPEHGNTSLIKMFRDSDHDDYYFQQASVYDVHKNIGGHLDDEQIEAMIAGIAPHKRKMRLFGEPTQGEGLVWDMDLSKVACKPLDEIPDTWERVCAIDIGNAHRSAVIFSAYDKENDTVYITHEFGGSGLSPAVIASHIRKVDKDIPVILPRDAWQDRGNGQVFYDTYKNEMLNVQYDEFYNTRNPDGSKDWGVEFGIEQMRLRFENGTLKIYESCGELLKEMASYHRKNTDSGVSKIVKKDDDYCDAARYSVMSLLAGRGIPKTGKKWSDVSQLNYWGRH